MALVPAKKSLVMGYRVLSCILIVVGAVVPVQTVWDLVDFASVKAGIFLTHLAG